MRLRLATYNVHKCRGMDLRVKPARVVRAIRELRADVIAIQEVFAQQAEYISSELGIASVFGPARKYVGEEYGNAVFSRFPILSSGNYDLTIRRREPRRCLRTDFQIGGTLLHLFAVHLGTSYFERRRQVAKLMSPEVLWNPELKGARAVVGDFNEWTRGLVTRTLSEHLESADIAYHLQRSRTYPGFLPLLHLDHVYYDPELQLTGMHLHRSAIALAASDHLPLVAEFRVGEKDDEEPLV